MTEPTIPAFDRRSPHDPLPCANHEKRLALAENSVSHMERTLEAVSTKLDLILAQITKVAILEEKHSNLIIDNDRAHKKIETLTAKVDTLATETRAFINHSQGRDKVLWLLAGCVGGLAIKIMFFMGSMGMHP
jgi:tetrahydromethanopterin S-methyltransferase subunit G